MASPRILGGEFTSNSNRQFYHCVSRVVDRRLVFQRDEKEVFRSILRKLEAFLGVRVATYCLMGNHFHLLLEVPDRDALAPLDAERLLALLPLLYDPVTVDNVAKDFASAREKGDIAQERAILERYERRRGDLSVFLKELKQRVSIFMNHRLGRTGTLWEGRFRSVLVEGGEAALQTVAAYIDLNPVRAGLVAKPEDYRWSGYGEACGSGKGAKLARENLGSIQREGLESPGTHLEWKSTQDRYRRLLYLEGAERKGDPVTGAGERRGIAVEASEAITQAPEGKALVPLPEMLRRKVRYFSDGAALGSAAFVDDVIEGLKSRGRLGAERKGGANRLRGGADWGELRVLRGLQVRVFGDPPG